MPFTPTLRPVRQYARPAARYGSFSSACKEPLIGPSSPYIKSQLNGGASTLSNTDDASQNAASDNSSLPEKTF